MDGKAPGPHPLTLADWPFGSAARRGLLETVLLTGPPAAGWTTRELERQSGVARGGLRHALTGAQAWGLLRRDPSGRWHRPSDESALAAPLRSLLRAIGSSQNETQSETTAMASPAGRPVGASPKRAQRRHAILARLASGPAHVTELSSLTGASRATTYRELRALRDARAIALERGIARRAA